MSVENWIDEVVKIAGSVSDGQGGQVRAYAVYEKSEFPDTLSDFPCAITYTKDAAMSYPDGGPNIDTWNGVTEFHLAQDVSKARYPAVMLYFARIRAAFAANRTLGDRVSYCRLSTTEPAIEGPVILQYGSEEPHLGLVAHWIVRERFS